MALNSLLCGLRLNMQVVFIDLLRQPLVPQLVGFGTRQKASVVKRRPLGIRRFVGRLFGDLGIGGFLGGDIEGWVLKGRFAVGLGLHIRLVLRSWPSCPGPHFFQFSLAPAAVNIKHKNNQEDQPAEGAANDRANTALFLVG